MQAAVLSVLVQARGIATVSRDLSRVDKQMSETSREAARMAREFAAVGRMRVQPQINAVTAGATAKIKALSAHLTAIGRRRVTAVVDVDTSGGVRGLLRFQGALGDTTARLGPLSTSLRTIPAVMTALLPLLAGVGAGLTAIVSSAGAAALGLGAMGVAALGLLAPFIALGAGVVSQFGRMDEARKQVQQGEKTLTKARLTGTSAAIKDAETMLAHYRGQLEVYAKLQSAVRSFGKAARESVSGGVTNTMRGLTAAMGTLEPVMAKLRGSFSTLGNAVGDSLRTLATQFASPAWVSFFQGLIQSAAKATPIMTGIFSSVARIMRDITTAAMPALLDSMDRLRTKLAGVGDRNLVSLRATIEGLVAQTRQWASLMGDLGGTFLGVLRAVNPQAESLVGWLASGAERMRAWVDSAAGQERIKEFFEATLPVFRDTLSLLGEMTKTMGLFGQLAGPASQLFLQAFTGLLEVVNVVLRALLQLPEGVQTFIGVLLLMSGPIKVFAALRMLILGSTFALVAQKLALWAATAAMWLYTSAQKAWAFVQGLNLKLLAAVTFAAIRQRIALLAGAFAMGAVAIATGVWTAAQWLLNAAMRANPIGLVIFALTALVGALVYAYKNSETFRAIVTAAWNGIKAVVGAVIAFLVPLITTAWNAIKSVSTAVWGAIKAVITAVWSAIKAVTTTTLNVLKAIITAAWTAIKVVTTTIWNAIKTVITTAWNAIKSVSTAVLSAIKAAITAAWNAIKSVTSSVWNAIKTILTTIWNAIKTLVSAALSVLKSTITTAWNAIKTVTTTVWGAVRTAIMNPVRSATEWVIAKVKWLAGALQAGFRSIWGIASDFAGGLRDRIQGAFRGVVNAIGGFVNKIIGVVNKIPGVEIKYKFTPLAQGGTLSSAGAAGAVPEQVQALARGGKITRPTAIVGEEAPAHPEWVISSNPAYRKRSLGLFGQLGEKLDVPGFARGGVLGNADTFASVAKKMGAGPKSTLALFMAGVVESGMRNLSYGDRDSRGILQIRDGTARGMGINNMSVAQSAAAFLGRGFWNKGSAMSLSKSGRSAGQVAQQTQGSAFGGRYDQERGRALGYLKAARGDKKGLGDLLKGALSAAGDVASALNPMDFISKLPGVGDLPGWIQGLGKHAISGVSKWIKDKVASIIPSGGGGGGSTTGLTDRVKDAVSYARSNGWSGGINSGFRSKAKQQALYDAYKSGRGNLAAPPGNSNHERGLAVDVSQPDQFARAMGRMGDGRLYRKVPGEPWHFSTTGYAQGGVLDGARKAMTSPFVGSYATGGIVPRDGIAKVHKGERVTPPGRSDGPMVHIEKYVVNDARHDEERLARKVGFRMRALGAID